MSRTALVVDDSSSIRSLVAYTLRQGGFDVLEGANGAEALTHLDGQPIAVIVTDLNMPVMDGVTFVAEARTRAAYRFTPILMLTTESSDGKKQAGKAAGATAWIVKPFDPARLLQVVAKVLP